MRVILGVALAFVMSTALHAETWEWSFTGLVPTGASAHSMVADGETFEASFLIDSAGTVGAGDIQFSGGHSSTFDTTGWAIAIFNDIDIGGLLVDALQVNAGAGSGVGQTFQAQFEFAPPAPGGPVTTGAIPDLAGITIDSAGNDSLDYFQLTYTDPISGETVNYTAATASNIVVTVSGKVPEPTSASLLALGLVGLVARRRR